MFTLRPESLKTFIEDRTINLPRFQRKQTWGPEKNFDLCISVFKDYPLGVVVIKAEGSGARLQKWLLDGRQRQNAIRKMKNPEEIYLWAKATLGLKSNLTKDEVTEFFWQYLDKYLGEGDGEEEELEEIRETNDDENNIKTYIEGSDKNIDLEKDADEEASEMEISEEKGHYHVSAKNEGLKDLLDLILVVHPFRGRTSGFTKVFDFHNEIEDLDYIKQDTNSGIYYVDSNSLLAWIESQKRFGEIRNIKFPPSKEEFYNWLTKGRKPIARPDTIKTNIDRKWEQIFSILNHLDSLDRRLQESKIGYLELSNCDDNDAKKIFEIINTAGTPLTAAEILSAKPSWNKKIENPDPEIIRNKDELYKEIGISTEGVVKWDIAATFLDRLKLKFIIGQ